MAAGPLPFSDHTVAMACGVERSTVEHRGPRPFAGPYCVGVVPDGGPGRPVPKRPDQARSGPGLRPEGGPRVGGVSGASRSASATASRRRRRQVPKQRTPDSLSPRRRPRRPAAPLTAHRRRGTPSSAPGAVGSASNAGRQSRSATRASGGGWTASPQGKVGSGWSVRARAAAWSSMSDSRPGRTSAPAEQVPGLDRAMRAHAASVEDGGSGFPRLNAGGSASSAGLTPSCWWRTARSNAAKGIAPGH
jgi:hypothetical protein